MTEDTALIEPAEARAISGGISDSTQRRLIATGDYPPPVVLSRTTRGKPARVAFVRGEVLAWCRRRIEAARKGAPPEASA